MCRGAIFDERGRRNGFAGDEFGQPLALERLVTELRDGQYPHDDRREVRDLGYGATDFFEHECDLEEAQIRTTEGVGRGDAEQSRVSQRRPRLAIEPLVVRLEFLVALGRDEIREDLPRQRSYGLLFFAQ